MASPSRSIFFCCRNNPTRPGRQSRAMLRPIRKLCQRSMNSIYNRRRHHVRHEQPHGQYVGDQRSTQTLVYRTQTVQLIADTAFGSASSQRLGTNAVSTAAGWVTAVRRFLRLQQPLQSQPGSTAPGTNATQRNAEAASYSREFRRARPRAHMRSYAGDHNFYYSDSQEPAWGTWLPPAMARPMIRSARSAPGITTRALPRCIHSRPARARSATAASRGGMDDRFDFQLVTGEFLDGAGLSYISGSYHAFGNNGSTFNDDINIGSNTVTFSWRDVVYKSQILNALHESTDHIPVVADYQVPAVMQAVAGTIPSSIDLGSAFNLGVTVNNAANVVAANRGRRAHLLADDIGLRLRLVL